MRLAFGAFVVGVGLAGGGDQRLIAPTASEGGSTARGFVITGPTGDGLLLAPGGREHLRGFVELANGSHVEITSGITWTVDRPNVATIDGEGWLHGLSEGTTKIHGRYRRAEGSAAVTVTPLPDAARPRSSGPSGGGSSGSAGPAGDAPRDGDPVPVPSPAACLELPLPSNPPSRPCPSPLPI
jgi:hypothetical protein